MEDYQIFIYKRFILIKRKDGKPFEDKFKLAMLIIVKRLFTIRMLSNKSKKLTNDLNISTNSIIRNSFALNNKKNFLNNLFSKIFKTNYSKNKTQTKKETKEKEVLEFFNNIKEPLSVVYCSFKYDFSEFRFPSNSINVIKSELRKQGLSFNKIERINMDIEEPQKINFNINENYVPRSYQEPIIDYLVNNNYHNKMVGLQTGKGKTFISMYSLSKMKERVALMILPRYIDKWYSDIVTLTDIKKDEIFLVRGSESLKNLSDLLVNNKFSRKYKIVIFSLTTIINFIRNWEFYGIEEDYKNIIAPNEIFDKLKLGSFLVDEVHQHFLATFKVSLFLNCKNLIGLSATLENLDPNIEKRYQIIFPKEYRAPKIEHDKYIHLTYVLYSLKINRYNIKVTNDEPPYFYNHNYYENGIMNNDELELDFYNMVDTYVKKYYLENYKRKDKCIIFVSTRKMATRMTEFFKNKYPKKDVKRYIEEDPYENIIDSDIRITTIKSGGTAIDIPQLTTAIQTIAMKSIQANKQALGRLRKLKDREVNYIQLYNKDIYTHMEYMDTMKTYIRDFVSDIKHEDFKDRTNKLSIKGFLF